MVRNLKEWTHTWIEGISASPPTFDDPLWHGASAAAHSHITNHLTTKVNRLIAIVDREQGKIEQAVLKTQPVQSFSNGTHEAIVSALHTTFDGPGHLREQGQRHDNDFADISEIRVAPTHQELICRLEPFLPANLPDAPHHLPSDSMERLLDIQFRLLREELTAPLRTSVQLVCDDMKRRTRKTQLSDLLEKKGGKYRGYNDGQDGIMFNVYTNVEFSTMTPNFRGLSVGLSFDSPPGRARAAQARARAAFWEGMSGKRLMQGGLVALVWQKGDEVDVHLGILSSSLKDLAESAKDNPHRVSVRVSFFDQTTELRVLQSLKHPDQRNLGHKVLIEAPVMFEAIRPFLEALRVEPESIPFGRYLVHHPANYLRTVIISPPKYALIPGFAFQLASLFPPGVGVDDLSMAVSDPASVAFARQELRRSRLDPSQCDAVVDALTREVALIQG